MSRLCSLLYFITYLFQSSSTLDILQDNTIFVYYILLLILIDKYICIFYKITHFFLVLRSLCLSSVLTGGGLVHLDTVERFFYACAIRSSCVAPVILAVDLEAADCSSVHTHGEAPRLTVSLALGHLSFFLIVFS